jgi:hypothetical protein
VADDPKKTESPALKTRLEALASRTSRPLPSIPPPPPPPPAGSTPPEEPDTTTPNAKVDADDARRPSLPSPKPRATALPRDPSQPIVRTKPVTEDKLPLPAVPSPSAETEPRPRSDLGSHSGDDTFVEAEPHEDIVAAAGPEATPAPLPPSPGSGRVWFDSEHDAHPPISADDNEPATTLSPVPRAPSSTANVSPGDLMHRQVTLAAPMLGLIVLTAFVIGISLGALLFHGESKVKEVVREPSPSIGDDDPPPPSPDPRPAAAAALATPTYPSSRRSRPLPASRRRDSAWARARCTSSPRRPAPR